jgi:hypothetical protein
MTGSAELERVAGDVIARELGDGTRIVSITVREDDDPLGGQILSFRVVYDSGDAKLDPKAVAGMVRHLRSRLHDEIAEERFPLLSFVSHREAQAEAA